MEHFDAHQLVGRPPTVGRIVESVEVVRRHLRVTWDDGVVLDSRLRSGGRWCLYRTEQPWQYSYRSMRASIHNRDFLAVCFGDVDVETYRLPDRRRHPCFGRPGPALARHTDCDLDIVNRIMTYPDPDGLVRDVVIDQRVVRGLGNVDRSELLWTLGWHPSARVMDLGIDAVHTLVDAIAQRVGSRDRLAVYGRTGRACSRCHTMIESMPVAPHGQLIYWCPQCQHQFGHHDQIGSHPIDPAAAAARYLGDHQRRHIRIVR